MGVNTSMKNSVGYAAEIGEVQWITKLSSENVAWGLRSKR